MTMLERLRLHWIVDARVSASIGYRMVDKVKLARFHAAIALAKMTPLPLPRPLAVRLAPDGHQVLISDAGEVAVLQAIFVYGEYDTDGAPAVIFDLGANVGFASLFFSRRYPDARIIAVEADPRTFERLARNVEQLANVTAVNRAVAASDGVLTLFRSETSISSTLIRGAAQDERVEVPAIRLDTLMTEVGVDRIDLLKIDIEGTEFEVLASAPLERVNEIIAEIHYDLGDGDEQTLRHRLKDFDVAFTPLPYRGRSIMRAHRLTGP